MSTDTAIKPYVAHVNIVRDVPAQRICDLLVGAFEGGSTYWAHSANWAGDHLPETNERVVWWGRVELYNDDFRAAIVHYDPKTGGEPSVTTFVTMPVLIQGLQLLAERYPRTWAAFDEEGDDASDADVFLQLVVFGDVIFG